MYKLENKIQLSVEIIPSKIYINSIDFSIDHLYWLSDENSPQNQSNAYFFCIDQVIEFKF